MLVAIASTPRGLSAQSALNTITLTDYSIRQ